MDAQDHDSLQKLMRTLELQMAERTAALEQAQRDLQNILDAIPSMVGYWDRQLINRFANRAYLTWFALQPEQIVGRHVVDVIGEDRYRQNRDRIDGVLEGKPQTFEQTIRLPQSGEVRHVLTHYLPDIHHGEILGYYVMANDITIVKKAEAEMRVAKEAAEAANAAKSHFLSRMSHELRTPLNAIIGFAQVLQADRETPLAPAHRNAIEQIRHAGMHLLELVNEVLDLARIEAGRFDLRLEAVDVGALIDACVSVVRPLAGEKGVTIESGGCAGALIRGDATRLRQVLLNLLSNAIKYNRSGGFVRIHCTMTDERLRVAVQDTGPGITPARRAELFQPFSRLGAERTTVEGTGIGLAISQRLIEAMSGTIGCDSHPGSGSLFWIELPLAKETAAAPGAAHEGGGDTEIPPEAAARVLYIEDNPANRNLMAKIATLVPGINLVQADSAEIGLQLARMSPPALILMDINLPGMNGIQALRAMREDDRLQATPIVAISADAMPHDIQRGMDAGFDDYITKPFDAQKICELLQRALRRPA